jgi:hypothetical protein
MLNCTCNFKVGAIVDWNSTSNPTHRYHGEVIADNGTNSFGVHWVTVRWTKSNQFWKRVRTIPQGTFEIVTNPWELKEECTELILCRGVGTSTHPRSIEGTELEWEL